MKKTERTLPHDQIFDDELKKLGVHKAIKKLFDTFWQPLFQFSYNILRNEPDAQDVVQEVFIALWKRQLNLTIYHSIESYLFTSVKYKSLTKLSERLSSSERNLPLETYLESSFTEAVDPLILKELEKEIEFHIKHLPNRMRTVIQLRTQEYLSIQEIAQKLNISEETVKNHLASARKRLRIQLKDATYTLLLISMTNTL